MVRQMYHNGIKSAWSYPGADANTDHNLVLMKCRVKLKKIQRCCRSKKWNVVSLRVKGAEYQAEVQRLISSDLSKSVEDRWLTLKQATIEGVKNTIGYKNKWNTAKKPWITEAVLQKMDDRRKWKGINTEYGKQMYKQLYNELRKETQKAREDWWDKECEHIEELNRTGRHNLVCDRVASDRVAIEEEQPQPLEY